MSDVAETSSRTKLYAIIAIVIIIGASAGVAGWWILTHPAGPGPEQGITLKIITRHDTAIWNVFRDSFLASDLAADTNVTAIEFVSPLAPLWIDVILDPAGMPDVAWGGGPTLFDELIAAGLLSKMNGTYMEEVAARVPDEIAGAPMKRNDTDGDNLWVAAAISSFGFTVNNETWAAKSLPWPSTWENLTSPDYYHPTATLAMGNAPGTTSNTRIYEIIVQKFGWDLGWDTLTWMGGNARIYGGSVQTQTAVETGEVAVGMTIDFYGYTSMYKYSFCQYVLPENGSIVNGDPIAIPTTCQHREAAEAFVDYVLSPEGQSQWLRSTINRMPVIEDAFSTSIGETRDDLYSFYNSTIENIGIPFDDSLVLSYQWAFIHYFESVITNAHTELRSVWGKLVNWYLVDPVGRQAQFDTWAAQISETMTVTDPYTATPEKFDEAYAQSINDLIRTDDVFRETIKSLWTSAAIAQYAAVEALIP
ncbi:MAG: ABC transporter substrate-binding protein [Candidatus Odinarchaeota archaeon]